MSKQFSRETLRLFEDASASVPLRALDRVFEAAKIELGKDPGGTEGTRRVQFRRYVASIDQRDPHQLGRLGDALGALIAQVAASKESFLIKAAARDGFSFADGAFRASAAGSSSFAVTRVEDLALIGDHGSALQLLASNAPGEAVAGGVELAESVCRTILNRVGSTLPSETASLAELAEVALTALEPVARGADAKRRAGVVRSCLRELSIVVTSLGEVKGLSARDARLAAGAAVTLATFVADGYVEQAG